METPNSLTEIEQRQRRRVRVSIVVSAVATAVLVIMGLLLVVFAALPLSDWRTWYLYVILAVTIVIAATLPMAVARTVRGITEFLRRLQPRTVQAGWERLIGPRVVFDNGLAFPAIRLRSPRADGVPLLRLHRRRRIRSETEHRRCDQMGEVLSTATRDGRHRDPEEGSAREPNHP